MESAKEQSADETVEMYRENLNKLLTKQSPTFQSLVEEYRDLWNQNITRFNYINELGNEVSVYDDDDDDENCFYATFTMRQILSISSSNSGEKSRMR